MKKMFFGALAVAAIAMTACSNGQNTDEQQAQADNDAQQVSAPANNSGEQEFAVDVEASTTDTVNTPEGPVVNVQTVDQITPID